MRCNGPKCRRPATAKGLCNSHYKQLLAGRPLTAIREKGSPLVLLSTRVPQEVIDALGEDRVRKARTVLVAWARRNSRSHDREKDEEPT